MGTKGPCSNSCRAGHMSATLVGLVMFRNIGVYNVTENWMIKCLQFCKSINRSERMAIRRLIWYCCYYWTFYWTLVLKVENFIIHKHVYRPQNTLTVSETAREGMKSAETNGHFINCKTALSPLLPRPVTANKSDFTRRNSFSCRLLN